MKMNSEKSNQKVEKSEEDIKARDKTIAWGAGAAVGAAALAMSPLGEAVGKSFNSDLLTPEVESTKITLAEDSKDVVPKDTERINVMLDGEEVASFERSQQPFPENSN
jgi:hypothetical protein